MTEQDKQILLVDLCARLPFWVKCQFEDTIRITDGESDPFYDYILSAKHLDLFINHKNFYIKPYLRPMSSMTEEEDKEFALLQVNVHRSDILYAIDCIKVVEWLNKHHFDYRGLISKGLALEAPDDMYKEEQQ